jgi:hypothetical protein
MATQAGMVSGTTHQPALITSIDSHDPLNRGIFAGRKFPASPINFPAWAEKFPAPLSRSIVIAGNMGQFSRPRAC